MTYALGNMQTWQLAIVNKPKLPGEHNGFKTNSNKRDQAKKAKKYSPCFDILCIKQKYTDLKSRTLSTETSYKFFHNISVHQISTKIHCDATNSHIRTVHI